MPPEILVLVKDFGFPALVCLWLLWRLDQKAVPAIEALVESTHKTQATVEGIAKQLAEASTSAQRDHTDLSGLIDEATQAAHQAATHAREAKDAAERAAASADKLYGLVHGAIATEHTIPQASPKEVSA